MKPSKSKEPTDAETLRALQFALAHPRVEMTLAGRDYVTQHVSAYGPRCHHKLIYACPICQSEKRYFLNLMPKTKFPFCDGSSQELATRRVAVQPFDEAAEHEADLRHESIMADESEYGPRCNLPDDEGWRQ